MTIYLDEELYRFAKIGDPWSRFVIAHEIGHAVLHDKYAKAFTGKEKGFTQYDIEERSAEWQANMFAGYLLAPDQMALQCEDASELARNAGIEKVRAGISFGLFEQAKIMEVENRLVFWRYLSKLC